MEDKKRIAPKFFRKRQKKRKLSKKAAKRAGNVSPAYLKEASVIIVLVLGCLVIFLRFGTHQVDGQSMFPTFQSGDRIFIAKDQHPERYEIITFEPSDKKGESYIKRVLGVPGDRIAVEGTSLFLSSERIKLTGLNTGADLPDGTIKITVTETVAEELSSYSTIPPNYYFVEGDNRKHSTDSRVFGLIHSNQIEGVVIWRYFPFSKVGAIR